jgi:hypothetical protein
MSAGNGCASFLWNRATQTTADPPTGCSRKGRLAAGPAFSSPEPCGCSSRMSSHFKLLIGLNRPQPLEEPSHCWQQLLFEQVISSSP